MASRASPGDSNHCRPSTTNSSSAVARSADRWQRVMKAPMASEMPAMRKASASCFLENFAVFEDGVSALVGFLLGSVGGEVIVAGFWFTRRSRTLRLWQCPLFPRKRTWSGARLCLLAPQADAALFIQLAPGKPSSLRRTRLVIMLRGFQTVHLAARPERRDNHSQHFSRRGLGLRCFQHIKREKSRSWSLARATHAQV
jgi:hypothetical protein